MGLWLCELQTQTAWATEEKICSAAHELLDYRRMVPERRENWTEAPRQLEANRTLTSYGVWHAVFPAQNPDSKTAHSDAPSQWSLTQDAWKFEKVQYRLTLSYSSFSHRPRARWSSSRTKSAASFYHWAGNVFQTAVGTWDTLNIRLGVLEWPIKQSTLKGGIKAQLLTVAHRLQKIWLPSQSREKFRQVCCCR